MGDLPEVLETIVVGPTDRLVIVLPGHVSMEDYERAQQVIADKDWSDRVLFVAGVEQLAVIKAVGPCSAAPVLAVGPAVWCRLPQGHEGDHVSEEGTRWREAPHG